MRCLSPLWDPHDHSCHTDGFTEGSWSIPQLFSMRAPQLVQSGNLNHDLDSNSTFIVGGSWTGFGCGVSLPCGTLTTTLVIQMASLKGLGVFPNSSQCVHHVLTGDVNHSNIVLNGARYIYIYRYRSPPLPDPSYSSALIAC